MSRSLSHIPTHPLDLSQALYESYRIAQKGKRRTHDEHKFEMNYMTNINQLTEDILARRYHPGRGVAFIITSPVVREIVAAPFPDRTVHHLLYEINGRWLDSQYIYDSYSCREGKGTLFGINRLQDFMEKASQAGSIEAYVIKADLSGYFMSIDREKLFIEMVRQLDRQFPNGGWTYELCRYLWAEVIFDDPIEGIRIAGSPEDWKKVPPNKSLFNQPPGVGIVIGNQTSQSLSNTYLNQLDRFMRFDLGFKYYGRYVDDFVVVVTKEELNDALEKFQKDIPEFLEDLGLKLHPKKFHVQPVDNGVEFLGRNVHRDYITAGKRIRGSYYKAAFEVSYGLKGPETIASYLGMTKHLQGEKMNKKVFSAVGWDYKPGKLLF